MAEDLKNNQDEAKTKVIKGTARIEKKSMSKKIVDFLFTDRIDSIFSYIGQFIVVPTLKKLLFDSIVNGANIAINGQSSVMTPQYQQSSGTYIPGYGYQSLQRPQVPYNTMANPTYAQPAPGYFPQRVTLNDISFDSKDDAYLTLDRMARDIARYGKVRVADFYTYAGITGQEDNWTLQSCGWYNLGAARPLMRMDGRWCIDFPPVQPLQ